MGGNYDRTKFRTGRIVVCKVCGKEFYRSQGELRKNKTGKFYCGRDCRNVDWKGEGNPNFNHRWSSELKEQTSAKIKEQYKNGRKTWCKGQTKETDPRLAKCGVIGNDFGKYTKGQKRVDDVWRNVLNSAGVRHSLQQEHKYKYHGENWLRIRKSVLQRDNFTCQKCGSKEYLVVHHLIPYRLSGSDDLDNLITLCRRCHGREEPRARKRATSRRH